MKAFVYALSDRYGISHTGVLQVNNYNNSPITFNLDGGVMVNATEMAKPFGKKTTHFIQNNQTQEFIRVLESKVGNPTLVTTHGGNNPGTWMHQKLALKFAGWLLGNWKKTITADIIGESKIIEVHT